MSLRLNHLCEGALNILEFSVVSCQESVKKRKLNPALIQIVAKIQFENGQLKLDH